MTSIISFLFENVNGVFEQNKAISYFGNGFLRCHSQQFGQIHIRGTGEWLTHVLLDGDQSGPTRFGQLSQAFDKNLSNNKEEND